MHAPAIAFEIHNLPHGELIHICIFPCLVLYWTNIQLFYEEPSPTNRSQTNKIDAVPAPHPQRFSSRPSATTLAGCVARKRTGAVQVDDLHHRSCAVGRGTAKRWMAQVGLGGGPDSASRHRRDAIAQTRSSQVGGYAAHCLKSAAVSTARHDVQILGTG